MLQFPGAPQFTAPVAVAIGPGPLVTQNGLIQNTSGFIYVADPQNAFGEVVRLPPGGGDLQPAASGAGSALNIPAGSSFPLTLLFGGTNITSPNGVAVDAAGNVYVSDSVGNAVWEAPATGPPNGNPFALNFSGLRDGRHCPGRERECLCRRHGEQSNRGREPAEPGCFIWDRAEVHGNFRCGRYAGGLPDSRKRLTLHWRVDRLEHRQPACHSGLDLRGVIRERGCLIQRIEYVQEPDAGGNHLHHLAALHSTVHRLERRDPHREWDSVDRLDGEWGAPAHGHANLLDPRRPVYLGAGSFDQRCDGWRNHLLHHQWNHADDKLVRVPRRCNYRLVVRNTGGDCDGQRLFHKRRGDRCLHHPSRHANLQRTGWQLSLCPDGNHQRCHSWRNHLLHHRWNPADDGLDRV